MVVLIPTKASVPIIKGQLVRMIQEFVDSKKNIVRASFTLFLLFTISVLFGQPYLLKKDMHSPASVSTLPRIEFADMDLDGDEDLVGMSNAKDRLFIFLNQNGTIDTFPFVVDINLGDFRIVDWNEDTLPDVLLITEPDIPQRELQLLINQGNLNFAAPVSFGRTSSPNFWYSFLEDVNNDGFIDIVDPRLIYENNGGNPAVTQDTARSQGLTIGGNYMDMNGDGMKDLVAWGTVDSKHALFFYESIGTYEFLPVDTLTGLAPIDPLVSRSTVLVEDLDNDGTEEIIFQADWRIFVLRMTGDFEFDVVSVGNSYYESNINWWIACVEDVDQNGYKDIIVNRSIFFNDNFSFIERNFPDGPRHVYKHFAVADTDGDGAKEIWESYGGYDWAIRMDRFKYINGNSISGREEMWKMYPKEDRGAAMIDVNNDGLTDMVYPSIYNLVLSLNQGTSFTEKIIRENIFGYLNNYQVFPADFDNDGWTDLIVLDFASNIMRWLRNNGDTSFEDKGFISGIGLGDDYEILGIEDLNNDGLPDLIVSPHEKRVNYLINTGSEYTTQQQIISTFDDYEYQVKFHDLNRDGFPELLIESERDRNNRKMVLVFENNAGNDFSQIYSRDGRLVGMADLTLDGHEDLLFLQSGFNILPSNGDGTFATSFKISASIGGPPYTTLDLNNDGLDDIIGLGEMTVSINTGTGFLPGVRHGVGSNDIMQAIDYDQDGDQDIFFPNMLRKTYVWENLGVGGNNIHGSVYYDANGNGVRDPGEAPLPDIKIGLDGFGSYAYSNVGGFFNYPLGGNTGDFEVYVEGPYLDYFNITSNPYPAIATVTASEPIDTVEIGLEVAASNLSLDLGVGNQRCDDQSRFWLNYFSVQSGQHDGRLELTLPDNVSFANLASLPPSVINSNTLIWDLEDLSLIESGNIWLDLFNPSFESAGDTLTFYSKMQTWIGTDTLSVYDTLRTVLTCAYDPNNKVLGNWEDFAQGDALYTAQDEVEYIIQFQNTGTDTARNVILRDNLSFDFEYDSFEFISASHPVGVSFDKNGLLEARFENILLPDSSTNFTGSQGYLKFHIQLKSDVLRAKSIKNGARIYFDQNPPVYTNIVDFQRVDCSHFLQVGIDFNDICGNSDHPASVYDYGLQQNYEWVFQDELVSTSDSVTFFIPGQGDFPLQLSTSNILCASDTVVNVSVTNVTPELDLDISGDTTFCVNQGIRISSPINCYWYIEDVLHFTGKVFYVSEGGTLRVESAGGECISIAEFELTAVDINTYPDDMIADVPANGFVFCQGDTMSFSASVSGELTWTYFGDSILTFNSPTVTIPSDPSSTITEASIQVTKDSLNCTILGEAPITFITDVNFVDSLQQFWLCPGAADSVWVNLLTEPEISDSLQVFRDGLLIAAYSSNIPAGLYLQESDDYEFIAFAACHESSLLVRVDDFYENLPELILGEDSLYTTNGLAVHWFFSNEETGIYESLGSSSALEDLATGYYFFTYEREDCMHISDTIFLQIVATTDRILDADLELTYLLQSRQLKALGNIPEGTLLEIYTITGIKLAAGKLQPTQTIDPYPAGIYLAVLKNSAGHNFKTVLFFISY